MTHPNQDTLNRDGMGADEILERNFNYALQDIATPNAVSLVPKEHLDNAKAQLLELILEVMPKKFVIDPLEGMQQSDEAIGQEWYNQAIEDCRQAFRKAFGGDDNV